MSTPTVWALSHEPFPTLSYMLFTLKMADRHFQASKKGRLTLQLASETWVASPFFFPKMITLILFPSSHDLFGPDLCNFDATKK